MQLVNILDVVKIANGSVDKFSGIKRYIATGDLSENIISSYSEVTYDNRPSRANVQVKVGQVIFARMKDTKKVLLIDDENVDFIYSTGFCVFEPSKSILSDYLRVILNSDLFQNQKDKYSKGVTQKAINNEGLKKIQIPLPPLETQKKIVEVLDKAQGLIDARKEQIRLMDELIQSVFYEMFGDPVTNPKGWEVKTFGKYITTLTDYHANGSYKILKENVELLDEPNFALMIRTTDLENDKYDNDVKYITKEAYNFLVKSKVYAEDLIINKIGSAGKVYYMPELNRPVSLGMNQFLVRTNKLLESKYLYYLFNTPAGESLILSKVRGAVTKSITKDAIREILLPIPNIDRQKEFVELVRRLEAEMNQMKTALEEHRKCFDVIMSKLFIS